MMIMESCEQMLMINTSQMMLKSDKFLVELIEHWDHETFDADVSDDDDFGDQILPKHCYGPTDDKQVWRLG